MLRTGGSLIMQVPFIYPLHDAPNDFRRWTIHGLERMIEAHGLKIAERQQMGSPIESAGALGAMAAAESALVSVTRLSPAILLIPVLASLVPVINAGAWLLSRIVPSSGLMPLGYCVTATKPRA